MKRLLGRPRDGESWQDYAEPCPNCGGLVLSKDEHQVSATQIDPAWWRCDAKEIDDV